jgi:hypothetical protein
MNLRLSMETAIIGNQDGIFAKPHITQANTTFAPVVASKPSNGCQTPSYGAVSKYFDLVCSSTMSLAVVFDRFNGMKRTVVAGLDWSANGFGSKT